MEAFDAVAAAGLAAEAATAAREAAARAAEEETALERAWIAQVPTANPSPPVTKMRARACPQKHTFRVRTCALTVKQRVVG